MGDFMPNTLIVNYLKVSPFYAILARVRHPAGPVINESETAPQCESACRDTRHTAAQAGTWTHEPVRPTVAGSTAGAVTGVSGARGMGLPPGA